MKTIRVTLAYPFEHDGKTLKADSTVELPREVGKSLLWAGKARLPAPKSPAKKASGNPATTATAPKEK